MLLNERINSLDPDSGKRFVLDVLKEVSEDDNLIPIPDEEMAAIKEWGNLKGEPSFLGSGSRGSAYKFGNKVLKFTNDRRETQGAALLTGKSHPNVYDVQASGQRTEENMKNSLRKFQYLSYVIVYEFLNYPTNAMTEAAFKLYHKVRGENKRMHYQWEDSNLDEARGLMREFVKNIKKDPTLLGKPSEKIENMLPKIKGIADSLGWDDRQRKLFEIFWTLIGGVWEQHLNSPKEAEEYTLEIIDDSRLDYFHQLALGLTFLKENGITFNDLKTSNIMEKNGQAAIIDVGYSLIEGNPELPEIEQ